MAETACLQVEVSRVQEKTRFRRSQPEELPGGFADLGKLPRGDGFQNRLNKAEDQAAEPTGQPFGATNRDPRSDLMVCLVIIFLVCLSVRSPSSQTLAGAFYDSLAAGKQTPECKRGSRHPGCQVGQR